MATYNCPPTAFTVSFSKTAVDNVPRILAFSNSAVPLPSADILQPRRLDAKSAVSIVPLLLINKLSENILLESIVHPAILPPVNNTCEPVICPEPLRTKLLSEEWMAIGLI